ncbi:MAG: calcium/sodium antiporter [Treponema sp.]|nr:calcium/sodium antiporter [Treponema sp.]MDY5838884.1 calcium/sodium antiporter [Treponema sp.]
MELFTNILLLIAGFIMLVKGADWFVDSAASLAKKIHIPELVIGLTLVAFGTSAPELSVSLTSALKTASNGITIGNVVGSNIMNIVLILGLTSVLCKIPCQRNSLILDIPYMLMATVLFIILGCIGNQFSQIDGIILVGLLIVYIAILVIVSIKQKTNLFSENSEETDSKDSLTGIRGFIKSISDKAWFLILLVLTGLVCIVYGSDLVVKSATNIAKYCGVSDRIIGLTMIALGTSLPELVTSVTAARKGKTDIAIGNIIGSNIFNILCVAGVSACFVSISFKGFFLDSIEALISALLLALLCYLPGHTIKRWGGFLLLAFYIAFMAKTFMTI